MRNELCMRSGDDTFKLGYDVGVTNGGVGGENSVVLPHASLSVFVGIRVNGVRLDTRLKAVGDAVARNLSESEIWRQLQYETAHSDSDSGEHTGFKLVLRCRLVGSLQHSVAKQSAVGRFGVLILNFDYTTPRDQLALSKLLTAFEYSLASLVLNLEFRFPYVFSVHGRRMLQINQPWMAKNINEVADSTQNSTQNSASYEHSAVYNSAVYEQNRNVVLLKQLVDLQAKIMYEFNALNIMKECDAAASRRASCKIYKSKHKQQDLVDRSYTKRYSVKNVVYRLKTLDHSAIEAALKTHTSEVI